MLFKILCTCLRLVVLCICLAYQKENILISREYEIRNRDFVINTASIFQLSYDSWFFFLRIICGKVGTKEGPLEFRI